MNQIDRRTLLKAGIAAAASAAARADAPPLKIALLHLEPELGELDRNCALYEQAMARAKEAGARWVLTPELGLTGYHFDRSIGTKWIQPGPDKWTQRLQNTAARLGVTLFLGHVELDTTDGKRYNTVFVISPEGRVLGRHRKINTIPVSEGWSTPGKNATPVSVDGRSVGILICADSWPPDHAQSLARKGAQILVSSATWPPEPHGPEKCWEQRTVDTGLPLFVCNRTGVEGDFDMRASESVVVNKGVRLLRHRSDHSSILLVEWDFAGRTLLRHSALNL
jgi:predicted amidohydrolase